MSRCLPAALALSLLSAASMPAPAAEPSPALLKEAAALRDAKGFGFLRLANQENLQLV